jgi:hypothetical protein
MKDEVNKWLPKPTLKELQRKREAGEISEEECERTSMASAVPEQEIQRSQNAFQDSMRSIADAEKQYVPPVSQSQKQPAFLRPTDSVPPADSVKVPARPLSRLEQWLTKKIHLLPDKWRLSDRAQEIVAVWVCISAVVITIASILIELTPLWMQITTGVFFLINLIWKFQLSGDGVSYTKFDRFCDAGDNTLLFIIGLGLLWILSTYTPGWVWVIIALIVVLVLVWDLLLFAVRSLGRAWRNE